MTKKKAKNSFEEELRRLEEIGSILESDDVGLDEAMQLYEEGIKLSKNCIESLKKAELKITGLRNELGKIAGKQGNEISEN